MNSSAIEKGFTLIEVMVAVFIMALIGIMAAPMLHSSMMSKEALESAKSRVSEVDRMWVLLENDFRNAVPKAYNKRSGGLLPAMYVNDSDDYWLTVLRSGMANPLYLPRTEMVRVGYRLEDDTIWRDTWYDVRLSDQEEARPRKVLTLVTSMSVRLLTPNASSYTGGPWVTEWPGRGNPQQLPWAIEITIDLEDFGEIVRTFSLLPGRI